MKELVGAVFANVKFTIICIIFSHWIYVVINYIIYKNIWFVFSLKIYAVSNSIGGKTIFEKNWRYDRLGYLSSEVQPDFIEGVVGGSIVCGNELIGIILGGSQYGVSTTNIFEYKRWIIFNMVDNLEYEIFIILFILLLFWDGITFVYVYIVASCVNPSEEIPIPFYILTKRNKYDFSFLVFISSIFHIIISINLNLILIFFDEKERNLFSFENFYYLNILNTKEFIYYKILAIFIVFWNLFNFLRVLYILFRLDQSDISFLVLRTQKVMFIVFVIVHIIFFL